MRHDEAGITYQVSPPVSSGELNDLLDAAWNGRSQRDFASVLQRSLLYICAYRERGLVGFVNVAWDGGVHAFILDTTVRPSLRRRGIGRQLVLRAAAEAGDRGIEWLHVDYEPHLKSFYAACGFLPTEAGLIRLEPRRG